MSETLKGLYEESLESVCRRFAGSTLAQPGMAMLLRQWPVVISVSQMSG
jgi:hypothetical protein